jgi:hypothetical protein
MFTSINDAYTTSMDVQSPNKYKRPDVFSQISQLSEPSTVKPFEINYEPFKNVSNHTNVYESSGIDHQYPSQESAEITCNDIIEHVRECEYCRSQIEPEDPYHIPEYLQNTILYVIMGIFILFLLDIFVRIGKLLSK